MKFLHVCVANRFTSFPMKVHDVPSGNIHAHGKVGSSGLTQEQAVGEVTLEARTQEEECALTEPVPEGG